MRTTFDILEAVSLHQPIGLSDLARRMDLPKSSVQRSLSTLADLGWIRADTRHRWTLGDHVRALAEQIDDVGALRDAAVGVLGDLNTETLETIHLVVPDTGNVRLVERVDSLHPLRFVQPIGSRSPLHASSTGKSILAHLPAAEVDAYLAGALQAVTSRTITDPDRLRAELAAIRARGFAVADNELADGIVSVGASIRPRGGRPVAALSVSGPDSRVTPDLYERYGHLVADAAAEIAERLAR